MNTMDTKEDVSNVALVQRILDRVREVEDFQPLLDHIADEVEFEVTTPDGTGDSRMCRGRQAVRDYFSRLGPIVTFWEVELFGNGKRVVALGEENFAIGNSGFTARSEFALEFYICDGWITRLVIVEDLSSMVGAERASIIGEQTRRLALSPAPQWRFSPLLPGLQGPAYGIPS